MEGKRWRRYGTAPNDTRLSKVPRHNAENASKQAETLRQSLLQGNQSNPSGSFNGGSDDLEKHAGGNTKRVAETRPPTPWGGEYAKSIVYAGLDAIVTCFALVSSISGGHLSSVDVLVLGFSNIVADGISMGCGDFLSSTTERDLAASERLVTDWDVRNDLHPQVVELVSTYESYGMDHKDAEMVVDIFAKYRDIFVDQMMATEKGMLPPDKDESPWKNGAVTFLSFLAFGCTPLLSFLVLIPFTKSRYVKFGGACGLAAMALIVLGLAKAKISGQKYVVSVLMVLSNGGIAAAAAYFIGWTLRNVFGLDD